MKKRYIAALAIMLIVCSAVVWQRADPAADQAVEPTAADAAAVVKQETVVKVQKDPLPAQKQAQAQKQPPEMQRPQKPPAGTMAEEEALYREGLAAYITSVNDTVTNSEALTIVDCVLEQAERYEMDEKLIMAVAQTESTYYSDAVSCADYKGLMQTGDVLAEEAGYRPEDLFQPEVSIAVGAGYMDDQLETFGDVQLALAAYNQGPGAVYAGSYSTGYADLTLERVENIEAFLLAEGYL